MYIIGNKCAFDFFDCSDGQSGFLVQEKSCVRSYSEVLLVPLTTPDFSMPYNVITITCTAFALYFGSLLNVLRRRVGEEERFLKNRGNSSVGVGHFYLFKIIQICRPMSKQPLFMI